MRLRLSCLLATMLVAFTLMLAAAGTLGTASGATTCPVEPPPQEEPTPPPPPPPAGFHPGLVTGYEAADFSAIATLGARLARTEFNLGEKELSQHIGSMAAALAKTHTTLQPLLGFAGRVPTSSEVKALGAVAAANPSVKHFELGNETSFGYQYGDGYRDASYQARARTYAVRVKEAAEVLAPYGAGVLAQAEDGGSGSSTWVKEMFTAVPTLSLYVAGWVIHPYTNQTSAAVRDTSGLPKLERMVANLASYGDTTIPIDVTEFGITSDNGRVLNDGKRFTYAEAASTLQSDVPLLRKAAGKHPIASFLLYQVRDQATSGSTTNREAYFGALQHGGAPKGAYTPAVKALLAE